MGNQPLIRQGWVRALLFIVVMLAASLFMEPVASWFGALGETGGNVEGQPAANENVLPAQLLSKLFISFVISVVLVFVFRKWVDRKSFVSLGLVGENSLSHAGAGVSLGLFLLGAGILLLVAGKYLQWTDISFQADNLFISLGLLFFVSFAEELVFRGYILNNLMDSLNKWMALAATAMVFALFHRQNPGVTPIALVNLFLGGLLLGINFIYTKNLWFGILLHVTWNFYQGPVLGYRVSGLQLPSLLQHEVTGSELLTGGDFGFEGSALDSLVTLLAVVFLAWLFERQFRPGKEGATAAN